MKRAFAKWQKYSVLVKKIEYKIGLKNKSKYFKSWRLITNFNKGKNNKLDA